MSGKLIFSIFLLLIAVNLTWLNYQVLQKPIPTSIPDKQTSCPNDCQTLINQAISNIPTPSPLPVIPTIATNSPNRKTPTTAKTRTFLYIPIPGNGETLSNSWVNINGTSFYFNTPDYPSLKEAYFEANLKLLNGNGVAYLRLFDMTAGVEVWGSEINTSTQQFSFVSSGKLTLRSGNHQYQIQLKSLTADTAIFNSARLKLVNEN
jgi:hypothetical protein